MHIIFIYVQLIIIFAPVNNSKFTDMEKINKGKFKKGISGNPAGRPVGSENRINGEVREMIKELIEGKSGELGSCFDDLDPRE